MPMKREEYQFLEPFGSNNVSEEAKLSSQMKDNRDICSNFGGNVHCKEAKLHFDNMISRCEFLVSNW